MSQPPASSRQPSHQPARSSQQYRPPADPVLQQRAWAAVLMSLIGLFGMAESGGNIRRGVYVVAVAIVIAALALWRSRAPRRLRYGGGRFGGGGAPQPPRPPHWQQPAPRRGLRHGARRHRDRARR